MAILQLSRAILAFIGMVINVGLHSCDDGCFDTWSDKNLSDLKNADVVVLLIEDRINLQTFLDSLNGSVWKFGALYASKIAKYFVGRD